MDFTARTSRPRIFSEMSHCSDITDGFSRQMLLKKYAYAIVSASFVIGSTSAFPWSDTSGTIRSLDRAARELVLADGKILPVIRGINLAKFNEGDHVVLHTETEKGKEIITRMTKGDRPVMPAPRIPSRTL